MVGKLAKVLCQLPLRTWCSRSMIRLKAQRCLALRVEADRRSAIYTRKASSSRDIQDCRLTCSSLQTHHHCIFTQRQLNCSAGNVIHPPISPPIPQALLLSQRGSLTSPSPRHKPPIFSTDEAITSVSRLHRPPPRRQA